MSLIAKPLGSRMPSPDERAAANQLRKIIALQANGRQQTIKVIEPDSDTPAEIILTPALSALLMDVLRPIGAGDAVTLVPVGQMLTIQQAADILNVPRPFLINLLEQGKIRHEKVGRHRRIRADELFTYKTERDEEREQALTRLAEIDAPLL